MRLDVVSFSVFSYAQQSLTVNDIFPRIVEEELPNLSSVMIKISYEKSDDGDSCYEDTDENEGDDEDLQFGEIEF